MHANTHCCMRHSCCIQQWAQCNIGRAASRASLRHHIHTRILTYLRDMDAAASKRARVARAPTATGSPAPGAVVRPAKGPTISPADLALASAVNWTLSSSPLGTPESQSFTQPLSPYLHFLTTQAAALQHAGMNPTERQQFLHISPRKMDVLLEAMGRFFRTVATHRSRAHALPVSGSGPVHEKVTATLDCLVQALLDVAQDQRHLSPTHQALWEGVQRRAGRVPSTRRNPYDPVAAVQEAAAASVPAKLTLRDLKRKGAPRESQVTLTTYLVKDVQRQIDGAKSGKVTKGGLKGNQAPNVHTGAAQTQAQREAALTLAVGPPGSIGRWWWCERRPVQSTRVMEGQVALSGSAHV
jgi:hypothetical protein